MLCRIFSDGSFYTDGVMAAQFSFAIKAREIVQGLGFPKRFSHLQSM